MAQQLVEKRGLDKHDPMRTLRMAGYGGIIFGPAATTWYGVLTKHVNLSSKNGTIAARVACDQLLFAPVNMGMSSRSYCSENVFQVWYGTGHANPPAHRPLPVLDGVPRRLLCLGAP
jgi:hypothetical protein